MDLTQEQKQTILKNRGLNPSEWDITSDMQVVPSITTPTQPSLAPAQDYVQKPTDLQPKTSPLQAFGASAAQGAIPATASGLGFMAGASPALPWNAAAIAAAPETMGISLAVPLISGLVGGGVSGYGAGKVQQMIEPQAAQDYVSQAQSEHPIASLLGGLADMPLAGMSPNPMNVVRAGGTLGKLATRMLPSLEEGGMAASVAPQEMQNLMNVGQGAAVNALQPNIEALVQGHALPSIGENLRNVATGALFNSPNAIGHAMGSITGHSTLAAQQDQYAPFKEAAQSIDAGNTQASSGNAKPNIQNGTVPEPASALQWQMRRLVYGKRKAVLITEGETAPEVPSGFVVTDTTAGSVIHDPNVISPKAVTEAVKSDRIGRLLDYGIDNKPETANLAVVIKDKAGNELLSVATDDDNRPRVFKKLSAQVDTKAGETISVVSASDVIRSRAEAMQRKQDFQPAQQEVRNKQIADAVKLQKLKEAGAPTIEEQQAAPTVAQPKPATENQLKISEPAIQKNLAQGGEVARPEAVKAEPTHYEYDEKGNLVPKFSQQEATPEARSLESKQTINDLQEPTQSELEQDRLENSPRAQRYQSEESAAKQEADKSRTFTALEQDTVEKMNEQGLPAKPSEQWYELLKHWGAKLRGVTIKEGKPVNEVGKEIAGEALIRQGMREVVLNKDKSGFDTAPHEVFHWFINDMETNGSAKDKAIVKRYYDLVSNSDEFKKINEARHEQGREAWTPNEFATTQQGMEFLRNVLSLKGETGFQAWKKDMAASLKTKFTKTATHEDYTRLIGHRFLNDAAYLPTRVGAISRAGTNPQQDEPATYIGTQKGFAHIPDTKLYNLNHNIKDADGKILHSKGSTVSENTLKKYGVKGDDAPANPQSEESAFLLSGPRIVDNEKQGDKGTPGKQWEGVINNKLNATEKDIYQKAGLSDFLKSKERITSTELKNWMREHGPKAEVHSYGMEGKVSEARQKYDQLSHEWYDNQSIGVRHNIDNLANGNTSFEEFQNEMKSIRGTLGEKSNTKEFYDKAVEFQKLTEQLRNELRNPSPRTTSAYEHVSPLDTKQPMPEWTATKSGRNVQRVDVVVPNTQKEWASDRTGTKDHGVLWQPDNLHENLPNTLGWAMIQYKTGQKGEKIAVIAEAQSRWGQDVRNRQQARKNTGAIETQASKDSDHPLLRDYNRLILKAAIDQARKEGATHIVVSDAETAMMTEGHDLNSRPHITEDIHTALKKIEQAGYEVIPEDEDKSWSIMKKGGKGIHIMVENNGNVEETMGIYGRSTDMLKQAGVEHVYHPDQNSGMRLNYDTILPKIAEELTGAKGEKVSLGEHKNANHYYNLTNPETGVNEIKLAGPRDNLIFRNPDGIPKIDASGLMYPLSADKLPDKFSMFEKRYSEESPLRANEKTKEKYERQSFLPFLTSRIDKIAEKLKSPTAQMVSTELHKLSGETDLMIGRIGNKMIAATKEYPAHQIDRVYKYLYQMDDHGSSVINLNPREKLLASKLTDIIREPRALQIAMGLQVKTGQKSSRQAGVKPEGYMFNMLDPKVAYSWAERPLSAESKAYDKAYIDHMMAHNLTREEASETLFKYKGALGNNMEKDTDFGAIRKAEGKGLPWEIADKNFASAAMRYGRRAARDLMYFKYIENNPKMRKALNVPDQFGVLPKDTDEPSIESIGSAREVKDALRSVNGIDMPRNPTLMAVARSASNAVMGVGTAARNIVNMPSFLAGYVQLKQLPLLAKAIGHMSDARVRAFENNAVKTQFQDFDAAGYYEGNPNPAIRLLDKFSAFSRKYQGRDLSNKFEGEFYYSLGELLATDNIARAKSGDKEATAFIKRFGDITDGDVLKSGKKITQDDIGRIAKRFTDAARGTYGEEGLPSWAIEGELAPFAALSRFSIEKSNTIWKDVILPAKSGNYAPLLRYSLGSLGVGLVIEKMNELLTHKRGNEPTINEILASGNQEALLPKAISLLQMSTFAGIVGDGAQLASRAMQGKSIKYNIPLSAPLFSLATDTLAGNMSNAAQAIHDGEDPFEVLGSLATAISTQSVQTMRYIDNNFVHEKDTEEKNYRRDLRVFNELQGEPANSTVPAANPFADMEAKKFKEEQDPSKLFDELQPLLQRYIKDYGSNPEMLKKKLEALKGNSYPTMPSPESTPMSFFKYIEYLKKTEGEEVASARLTDYLQHKMINHAKTVAVPSL